MIIKSAVLAGIQTGFRVIFNEAFANADPQWQRVAMLVPSMTKQEIYAWLGAVPSLREWVGDRVLNNIAEHGYTIINKDWEATIEVDRNDIDDDNLGVYSPLVAEIGRSAAIHPDELVFGTLLANAFSTECYDGQYFFDTDHPVNGASVSNYGGGASTAWYLLDTTRMIKPFIFQRRKSPEFVAMDRIDDEVVFMQKKFRYGVDCRDNAGYGLWQLAYASKATLDATSYAAARAAMMAFQDEKGKTLAIRPNLLVVPPSLEGTARTLLLNDRDAAGATNPWKGTAEPMVVPHLA